MQHLKTYFEQIPVEVVKKIAEQFDDGIAGNRNSVAEASPSKLKPQLSTSLRKQGTAGLTMQLPQSETNCSICGKPVALETAKTDEAGQAAHGECYLFKIGINAGRHSEHASKQVQRSTS